MSSDAEMIKCNRVKPTCEACSLFQAPCIYDAVPKKRGPKTDVLEALLKRVDGLEQRLKDENKSISPITESSEVPPPGTNGHTYQPGGPLQAPGDPHNLNLTPSHTLPNPPHDVLLDAYFTRAHGKPYSILDEASTRQLHQAGQLPNSLLMAIYAVSVRFAPNIESSQAVRSVLDYAERARAGLDVDEPSIETLQTLLMLCIAFFSVGKGRRVHMLLSIAIGMTIALELHREAPQEAELTPLERETRRRLFWTCYLMDRFMPCGSKRPSLISDRSISLRLPSSTPYHSNQPADADFFWDSSNLQQMSEHNVRNRGFPGNLIEIAQILGATNQYLAAGGVKGDSHFPWHSLSNVSKIRQRLDMWASTAQEVFATTGTLSDSPESTTALLSRLIYHTIYCLIFRPFLPIDLAELSRGGQHQSWQIQATKLCFSHANAIADLVESAASSSGMEWSSFTGYCVCTAATVHIHGVHYKGKEAEAFSSSGNNLSLEMRQLSRITSLWAGVQRQEELLQRIYSLHSDLVRTIACNPVQNAPVFNIEDFFDRYPGQYLDGSYVTYADVDVRSADESDAIFGMPRKASVSNPDPRRPINGRSTNGGVYQTQPTNPNYYTPSHNQRHGDNGGQDAYSAMARHQNLSSPTLESPNMTHMNHPNGNTFPHDLNYTFNNNIPQIPDSSPFSPSQQFMTPSFPASGIAAATHPFGFDTHHQQQPVMTPSAHSQSGSLDAEHDPFLSLLEQLADNEHSRGGPSELDYFLSAQGQ
ncbi:MAG: hypothetical protein M4579_006107 [Chaenotheca gracillima]|nr:MAG: hypothetical protein M4579_006107 [Chaenotheca gracillima]